MFSLICLLTLQTIGISGWSYEEQEKWPESCKGSLQSPIALPAPATNHSSLGKFKFSPNILDELPATMTNSGHTVVIRFTEDELTLSGGGLEGEYVLDSFHFHWSSEHVLFNYRYPLEGHFVYRSKSQQSLSDALQVKNGVAVLAVFYKISKFDYYGFSFVTQVPAVAHKIDQPVQLTTPISLRLLLPSNLENFYRYYGSLTTPECNEVVVWTVFEKPSIISEDQKQCLSRIWNREDAPVEKNYRQLQELNDRSVYRNSPE